MKITGGKFRGRELVSPKSERTHPMGSRERLAIFNSIQSYLQGASVLDLYAGTGALGLEAISRGAAEVTLVENDPKALAAIEKNVNSLKIPGTIVVTADVDEFARYARAYRQPNMDVIFMDPPYDQSFNSRTFEIIAKICLNKGGVLVLSHPDQVDSVQLAKKAKLELLSTKSYAAANVSIFTH